MSGNEGAGHVENWRKSNWDRGKSEYKSCEKTVGLRTGNKGREMQAMRAYFILSVMGSQEKLLFAIGVTSVQERDWEPAATAESRWEVTGACTRVAAEATAQSRLDLKLPEREELGDLKSFGPSRWVN